MIAALNYMSTLEAEAAGLRAEVSRLKARLKDRERRIRMMLEIARNNLWPIFRAGRDWLISDVGDLRRPLSNPRVAKLMRAGLSEVTAKTVVAIAVATRRPLSKTKATR